MMDNRKQCRSVATTPLPVTNIITGDDDDTAIISDTSTDTDDVLTNTNKKDIVLDAVTNDAITDC